VLDALQDPVGGNLHQRQTKPSINLCVR
jgi:hypothetical protein